MKRNFLCCATLALAAGASPSAGWAQQPVTKDARQWLEQMLQSTQSLSYEGTFVYVQGAHLEAMRIVNDGGTEGRRRRLFSLSGPSREVMVSNNSVVCMLPKRYATFIGDEGPRAPFPPAIPSEIGRMESRYALEMLGEDRVAGLDAQIIAIQPRDAWRFGYRLWLDRRNGIVLRSALLDEKGYPVEQLMFTDLQLKSQIDDAVFAPSPADTNAGDDKAGVPVGERVTKSAWRIGQLPEGFMKVSHNRFTKASGHYPTEHIVLSDGLATISVFVEKLNEAPPLLQGGSQMGSINAFGVVVNDHQILVVGEAPAATVQRIAASIQHDPEASTP